MKLYIAYLIACVTLSVALGALLVHFLVLPYAQASTTAAEASVTIGKTLPMIPTGTKLFNVYFEDDMSAAQIWFDNTTDTTADAWTFPNNIVFRHLTVADISHEATHLCVDHIHGDLRDNLINEALAYCIGNTVDQIIRGFTVLK